MQKIKFYWTKIYLRIETDLDLEPELEKVREHKALICSLSQVMNGYKNSSFSNFTSTF